MIFKRHTNNALYIFTLFFGLSLPAYAHANFVSYFKEEDGSTNWQYIANFSSSVLILLLLVTSIFLFLNARRAYKANKALKAIKNNLEVMVKERTEMLEGEVTQHKETTTLLQSSEAYIKSILDSMPLMLIGLNSDLEITQWNNQAEKTTGVEIKDAMGKYLWDAYPTITVSPEKVQEVLKKGESTTIKLSQRGQYYFDITLYPLINQPKTGIVVLVDDVTQESKAANLLIQRDKFSAMGELASTMAHDISLPLQDVQNTISEIKNELAASSEENAVLSKKLDEGLEGSRQASAIINHHIEFANSESEKKLTSIPEIIDRAVEVAEHMFSDAAGLKFSDILITRTYADELHLVPCHASEIQQVCISVLRHACYALSKPKKMAHAPAINIDVSEFYDSLWVKIQHNGQGLNGEEQMSLFEPFYQNQDAEEGVEMENRLSFPYFIVTEHHGGQMAVTSDVEVGTTFHIQLQLK